VQPAGRSFTENYVVPMGRAIWSAEQEAMLGFPARFFIDFFQRHGFLSVDNRPQWQVVSGGSRAYVRALLGSCRLAVRSSTPVTSLRRLPHEVVLQTAAGQSLHFAIEGVEVRDASVEELAHGHVHGAGGHQH